MAYLRKRISDLPEATGTDGLYTLGVDSGDNGVKVPFGDIIGGLAPLDDTGKVPVDSMPASVFDVREFGGMTADGKMTSLLPSAHTPDDAGCSLIYDTNVNCFHLDVNGILHSDWNGADTYTEAITNGKTTMRIPVAGKIYVDVTTDKAYRWNGTTLKEVGGSLALGHTSETAFPGDEGKELQKRTVRIAACIRDGMLTVAGAGGLVADGAVPYIFRLTRKRNRIGNVERLKTNPDNKYAPPRKGWNVYGGNFATKAEVAEWDSGVAVIRFAERIPGDGSGFDESSYKHAAETLVASHVDGKLKKVAWGRQAVWYSSVSGPRMVRLPFAIAFGPDIPPGRRRITPADMYTNLARFSVIYHPYDRDGIWTFGK